MTKPQTRWQMGEEIGRDAVGTFHRAETPEGPATLRRLHEHLADRPDARLLFEEEARRIGRLDHPALLRVLAQDAAAPLPWLLTEPIDGVRLADAVPEGRSVVADEAIALARRLLDGLDHLHRRKQVHVAPFPSSVVRTARGWCWTTFRDVRARDELRALKGRGGAASAHLPPEADADHPEPLRPSAWNAWAIGALLRHLAGAGAPRDQAGRPAPLPSRVGPPLALLVARLTDRRPHLRPPDTDAVRRLLDDPDSVTPPPPGPPPIQAPVPRKRRRR